MNIDNNNGIINHIDTVHIDNNHNDNPNLLEGDGCGKTFFDFRHHPRWK